MKDMNILEVRIDTDSIITLLRLMVVKCEDFLGRLGSHSGSERTDDPDRPPGLERRIKRGALLGCAVRNRSTLKTY